MLYRLSVSGIALRARIVRCLACGLLCVFTSGCATLYNPATGRNEFILMPTATEVALGNNVHQQLKSEFTLSTDQRAIERLQRIGARVAAVSDRRDYTYQFYLIEKDEMNACTTPGGNIYMFRGLMNKLESDDAIAAVLAHEVGHCAARHTAKRFQAVLGYNLISMVVFSQVGADEKIKSTAMGASNTVMNLVFSAYSRKDEYQADTLGIKYLRLAGYDPNAMIQVLAVLRQESKGPRGPLLLRSHPYLEDRIAALEKQLAQPPYMARSK